MRTLTITLNADWKATLRQAGAKAQSGLRGRRYAGEFLNFEAPAQFFGKLTERRWELVRALQGAGPMSGREAARRVERDPKRVHEDLQVLIALGLVERQADGAIVCPFDEITVDMCLRVAA